MRVTSDCSILLSLPKKFIRYFETCQDFFKEVEELSAELTCLWNRQNHEKLRYFLLDFDNLQ